MRDVTARSGAVLLAGLVLLAGCSDDAPTGPSVEDFAAGACRQAAPDVLDVVRQVGALGRGPRVADEAKAALRATQDRLAKVSEPAAAPERAELEGLVQSVGLLRIRADGNTYEPFLGDDVRAAADRVVTTCTAR